MAFSGHLLKFGKYVFPLKYIKGKTYRIKPNQRQNLNAYTDANGVTHTNPLKHTKSHITFTTLEMSGKEMDTIMENLVKNYGKYEDRNAECTYYDPENNTYKTGEFYLDQSLDFPIDWIFSDGKAIRKYGEMQWTFTEK